jgi:hypothetical protein
MRKCPTCDSQFVCWNWIRSPKDSMNLLNPDRVFMHDQWYHECWDCTNVFPTNFKVVDGIEYDQLCKLWIDPYDNAKQNKIS